MSVRRWLDACWPLALLILFIASFRTTSPNAVADSTIVSCDAATPSDVPALERCLARDPDNAEMMTDLADRYRQSGNLSGAEALYRRALVVDSHNGDVHRRLGELLLARGDAAAARAEGEAALAVQPNSLADEDLIRRAVERARSRP